MKKISKIVSGVCVTLLVIAGVYAPLASVAEAHGSLNLVSSNVTKPLATTTTAYITAGLATTTMTFYTTQTDQIAFNLLYQASSTAATNFLNWRYEYSWDATTWFSESVALNSAATTTVIARTFADNQVSFASSTAASSNITGSNSINYYHFNLLNIASPFTRIVFYVPASSGPAGVYVQAVLKENNTN